MYIPNLPKHHAKTAPDRAHSSYPVNRIKPLRRLRRGTVFRSCLNPETDTVSFTNNLTSGIPMKTERSNPGYAFALIALFGALLATPAPGANVSYTILETADHDAALYTQGLIVDGDDLIESAGLYGESSLVRYNAATGNVLQRKALPAYLFAEGIHHYNGSLYLLTWQEHCAFRLDSETFIAQQLFTLETEGWGLTHNGQFFIQSDGSDVLFFRNSETFKVEKKLPVREGARPRDKLNELEFAHGLIWANVYMTPLILAISPDDGHVAYTLDLSALADRHADIDSGLVLNGIAYDPQRDAFWVTGKCWNKRYLLKIDLPAAPSTPERAQEPEEK
jgi:glutamine cyclotransferase